MQFSNTLETLCKNYALTPQLAAAALLVARCGLSRSDVAALLLPQQAATTAAANGKLFNQLCSQYSGLSRLIGDFSAQEGRRRNGGCAIQLRTKEAILSELEACLPELSGKERAAVLCQIADLQRFRQQEAAAAPVLVHFYIPNKRVL